MDTFLKNLKEQINEILDEAGDRQLNLSSQTARDFISNNITYIVEEYLIRKEEK